MAPATTKTPIQEWHAEFIRTVQTSDGTNSQDVYLLSRGNPKSRVVFSVEHGEEELPHQLADAMNSVNGYDPAVNMHDIGNIFYGPWTVDDRGNRRITLTSQDETLIKNAVARARSDAYKWRVELKAMKGEFDKLQRSYIILDQAHLALIHQLHAAPNATLQDLRERHQSLLEKHEKHPELFEKRD